MKTIEKGIVLGSKGKLKCVLVKDVLGLIDERCPVICNIKEELKARIKA